MQDKKSRQVFIINNIQSDSIDQAIFILKEPQSSTRFKFTDENIADEAQKIINNYMHRVDKIKSSERASQHKRGKVFPTLITVGITAAFMSAVFFTIVYNM